MCTLVVMTILVALSLAVGCNRRESGDGIKVGLFGSETGLTATFGVSCKEGAMLALDEINARGGVLGKKIIVISEDDQSKPEEARTAAEKLINRDGVVAVVGEVASSRTLAAAPVAQAARIPLLSPASTNPKVTQVGEWVFRACFTDAFQSQAMAKFAMEQLKAARIAVLYDVKNDYSVGLHDFFVDYIKKHGGQIVDDVSYSEGDVDFHGQLTRIKNARPDAIYVPGYYTEVGLICSQARQLGIAVPLMGGDGWDSDKTAQIGGDAVNGCYFTNHYSAEESRPEVKAFVTAYRKKYNGKTPDAMAILGYDAMRLMADAIARAGSTEAEKIRLALAETKNFPGASGSITMDKNRDPQKPIVVLKIENKVPHFVASVQP